MDEKQTIRVQRKMVVVGDGACGKTCLLQTFRDGQFPSDDRYIPTVFDVCIVDLERKGGVVELALWDTAGQEDFDRLRVMSYPEADVVVICFSVDSRDSLENVLEKWVPEAREHAPRAKLVLAALKIDLRTDEENLEHMRRVLQAAPLAYGDGVRLAKALGAPYVECSAKMGVGVRHVLETAVSLVVSDDDFSAVFRLILEGLAMFAGSWAAGCVPLYVRMDQSKFNLLALFGAGLLIGAALAVILPEGVETLSRSLLSHKTKSETDDTMVESMNTTIGWTLVAGFCVMFLIDNLFPSAHSHADTPDVPDNDSAACLEDIQMTPRGNDRNLGNSEFTLNDSRLQYQQHTRVDDSMASLAIINGDESQHSAVPSDDWRPSAAARQQPVHPPRSQPRWRRLLGRLGSALSPRYLPSTLIGILVHSCADGLALGAAVASAHAADNGKDSDDVHSSSLEIIVFMALLLHKAPAAFGLITTLKQQGYAAYKLSVWLTVFAASAPLAALATFSIFLLAQPASPAGGHHEKPAGTQPWAGIVMLFSAGTFMYVAMAHTLAEAVHQAKALRAKAKASATNAVKAHAASLSFLDIAVLLLGVILPPLVSKDHDG
ncbi:hypothetical protein GGI17_000829 [Coemansia sp. S146]|nr:hypothetical protein GGI17_000829 [Coemansia sp. S146]